MRKLLFLVMSAILAGASFCSSASERFVAKVTNNDIRIEQQQNQNLVLEQATADFDVLASHSSHSSHRSHSSHSSHRSHSSHYSSR